MVFKDLCKICLVSKSYVHVLAQLDSFWNVRFLGAEHT